MLAQYKGPSQYHACSTDYEVRCDLLKASLIITDLKYILLSRNYFSKRVIRSYDDGISQINDIYDWIPIETEFHLKNTK